MMTPDVVCVGVLGTRPLSLYTVDNTGRPSLVINVSDAQFHTDAGQVNDGMVYRNMQQLRVHRQLFWVVIELCGDGHILAVEPDDLGQTIVPIHVYGMSTGFDDDERYLVLAVTATKVVVGQSLRAELPPAWLAQVVATDGNGGGISSVHAPVSERRWI